MKRYQVYLNSQSVRLIDTFETESGISRSQLIRLTVDTLGTNISKLLVTKRNIHTPGVLDSLVGLIKGKKPTNFATKVDDIYLSD